MERYTVSLQPPPSVLPLPPLERIETARGLLILHAARLQPPLSTLPLAEVARGEWRRRTRCCRRRLSASGRLAA
jgi:hypothetical protein